MWLLTVAVLGANPTDTRIVTLNYRHPTEQSCQSQGIDATAEIIATTQKQARFWCKLQMKPPNSP